jgi:hypothetical protein
MAIKWRLVDIDDNTFDLDDGIFLVNNDNFKIDLDIEERTFLDGGIFDGISRMETKEMEFKFIKNFQSDADYRDYFNEIIYEFRKAVKIQDIINSIETEIEFAEFSITYTDNSYLRVSENSILIYLKNVLWETINYTTVNIGGSSPTTSGTQALTNNGWTPVYPIITLTANTSASNIFFVIQETNKGIKIIDLQFGDVGLTEYIINCLSGFITLGGLKRNENIQSQSGPFAIPIGSSTLEYIINGDVDIEIKYKEKYYI